MRTITNNYRDAQILNLGTGAGRGPYLVTQTGVAPTDQAYACQGKPEAMDEIVFPSIFKLMATLGRLMGRPQIVDLPIDEDGLKAWIGRQKSGDPLEAAHAWVSHYRLRPRLNSIA